MSTAWKPGALLRLETERFILRSLTREDMSEAVVDWMADPQVMVGFNLPRRRLSRMEAVAYVLAADHRSRFRLGIALRDTGELIGLYQVEADLAGGWAETMVAVGKREWWGRDVVKETRTRLLDFLFDELQLNRVVGRPHGRNISSIYNYKALGFKLEGVLREQLKAWDGPGHLDQLIFGLLRREWQQRRAQLSPSPSSSPPENHP